MRLWEFETPGIPDELFAKEGSPITREEVRSVVLGKLRLSSEYCLWDVGSGTGSVGIEAARFVAKGSVWAVEMLPERINIIKENIKKFGVKNVTPVLGEAPCVFPELPAADRVFIGGGGRNLAEIIRKSTLRLKPAGRLVMTAVTLESLQIGMKEFNQEPFCNFEVTAISISRLKNLNGYHLLQPEHTVHILTADLKNSQKEMVPA